MTFYPLSLVILTLSVVQPAISVFTMTVTNDMVFSGETATLTCSVTADEGETVNVKLWTDSSASKVIGIAAGDFEKNGVSYRIVDLETTGEQVFSWSIEVEALRKDISLTCWAWVNGNLVGETGKIDVVRITSSKNTVTLTGESTSVSCSLTGASSETSITVKWSQNGSPITGEEGCYNLSTDFSGSDKVAVLAASGITSDQTFTCTLTADGGLGGRTLSLSSAVNIDHVTIQPISYHVTGNQTTAVLSCVLSGANQAPTYMKWLHNINESEITKEDKGFEFYSPGPFKNGRQNFVLIVDAATESSSFICCFEFSGNVCKRGVANMEVTREHSGTKDDLQVAWIVLAGISLLGNVLFTILATLTWIKRKRNRGETVSAEHVYVDNVIQLNTSPPSTTIRPEEPFYDTIEIDQV